MEIDLETGEKTGERKTRVKSETTEKKPRTTVRDKVSTEIESRLKRTFTNIGKRLRERGDDELGDAFIEEADVMTGGFVSLTNSVKPLRSPLLLLLSVVEVGLAFGRVGSILVTRAVNRRERRAEEMRMAQEQYIQDHPEETQPGGIFAPDTPSS